MKVSIITVVFNGAKTIEQTIKSVINQSYKDIEYIIIDGGSTDRTLDVIKKYEKYISHVVSEPDKGIYDAMNKGIRKATGDIIGIINSDDWYEENTISQVVENFLTFEPELVYGNINFIQENGKIEKSKKYSLDEIWDKMVTPHPSVFIRKDIYDKYGLFNTEYKVAADYELILRLYSKGIKFSYIDDVLANFRIGGYSIKRSDITEIETIQVAEKYLELCPYKETLKIELEKRKIDFEFRKIYGNNPELIIKNIEYKLEKWGEEVIIFGTGIWGERIATLIDKSLLSVKYFVDNNEKKWNNKFDGKVVLNPEILKDEKASVVIAVKNYEKEIVEQLKNYKNDDIKWIILSEIMDEVVLENRRNSI